MKIKLKALRVNADLNQIDAAKAIGVTERTLKNWEDYTTYPNAMQLIKICSVYGCELNDIFLPDALANS